MRLYDTHCHFEHADPAEIAAILARARAAGVEKLMAVGGSDELNQAALLAAGNGERGTRNREEGPGNGQRATDLPEVVCALGYDRDQVGRFAESGVSTQLMVGRTLRVRRNREETEDSLVADCGEAGVFALPNLPIPGPRSPTPVPRSPFPLPCALRALGEIGLDYYYSRETRDAQLKLFAEQLELARANDLPVVIHTREADEDTVALLKEIPSRGIIHCYTGTPEYARRFLDLGFYISFSGIVTFRAADNVRASVKVVPDDRILIETDSPFLAPVPMRGKPNEPAFIRHTCEFLATFRGVSAEDFAELTFANAERILG